MPRDRFRTLKLFLVLALILALPTACSSPPPAGSPSASDDSASQGSEQASPSAAATIAAEPPAAEPATSAQDGASGHADQKPSPGTKWGDATIPAGTVIVAELKAKIDSGSAQSGTIVHAVTDAPLKVGEVEVLPAGSTFDGVLGQVIPAGEGGGTGGTIAFRWRLVRTPVGSAAPLKAEVRTAQAAPGGSPGLLIAGPEAVVEGTWGGTVLAAGAKGQELILEKGTRLTLVMSDPVPIKVRL